ncbi:hypothetical protein Pcinc_014280 [Petrolisthes cinctipes]|uniref:Uncharacterized protein n=1 Tax=Petrolisthes cinctipes TaxID=88211 RepID=A0AAE1KRY0_PETCI|nr:hypothetical protein Pcinc_014280 [Petrolisthes cinctipes]
MHHLTIPYSLLISPHPLSSPPIPSHLTSAPHSPYVSTRLTTSAPHSSRQHPLRHTIPPSSPHHPLFSPHVTTPLLALPPPSSQVTIPSSLLTSLSLPHVTNIPSSRQHHPFS